MKGIRFVLFASFFFVLAIGLAGTAAQDEVCPAIVEEALASVAGVCADTGRNQACHGNLRLEVEPRPGFENLSFEQPGDKANIAEIQRLTLSAMDTDSGDWGVVLMQIQANLPDALPGQNVTFLLFGDVELENAVEPEPELTTLPISASSSINVRSGPSTTDAIVSTLGAGQELPATGRLEDGSWLRVELGDGQSGWVFASLVNTEGDIGALAVVEPGSEASPEPEYRPLQAFYFRSGVGDAPCSAAPNSGILIQTPAGVAEISLVVNEVNITMGSTVFLQAQAPGQMRIYGIEDRVSAGAFGAVQPVPQGTYITVPLDENRAAAGPPGLPQPYDLADVQALPLDYLGRPVPLPSPLSQEQINLMLTATPGLVTGTATPQPDSQASFSDFHDDVLTCDTRQPASDPEADLTGLIVRRGPDDELIVWVYLREPLVNDYSFAVLLVLLFLNDGREDFRTFLWEVHDGVFRIGEVGSDGEVTPGSQERVTIVHDTTIGVVTFVIPRAELPQPLLNIGARSFHTPHSDTQPQPTFCDFAGMFTMPQALR